MSEIRNLEPKEVWEQFYQITQLPRPSKKEEKILDWLRKFASDRGYSTKEDEVGNLLISAPATKGMEDKKKICIQAHVDMVTEKNGGTEFDFDNDSIQTQINDDWVSAVGTTLGADNGMGLAMGLAIIENNNISRPATDILCTVDEETGLTGANQLSSDLIDCDILINLDTEEFGHFTIGCAGGMNTLATYNLERSGSDNLSHLKLSIKGLKGGHSGLEIHTPRANSNVLLFRALWNISRRYELRICNLNGGNKHNAIPRESSAVIAIPSDKAEEIISYVNNARNIVYKEWHVAEPKLSIDIESTECDCDPITANDSTRVIESLYTLYHGVIRMHPEIEGLVQSSTNFAAISTEGDQIKVLTSQRSSVNTEKYNLANVIRSQFELGGASTEFTDGYPAWEPSTSSPILKEAVKIYKDIFNKEPVIETVHAGLECGIIAQKTKSPIDMLSFGPDIREAHNPEEKVSISSTADCWKLLKEIVANIPAN
jgi:dipeptidase D